MEQPVKSSRTGWMPEESDRLFSLVAEAGKSGQPLRGVFEQAGHELGRKPNSIRNYYYAQLREHPDQDFHRVAPFTTFTANEVDHLLETVLSARGQGISVRACVMDMAKGDRSLMLRYQNKYRSILKNKPELLEAAAARLRDAGKPCPQMAVPTAAAKERQLPAPKADVTQQATTDTAMEMMLSGLSQLLNRAAAQKAQEKVVQLDRLQVRYDLARMAWEDEEKKLANQLEKLMSLCRDFIALPADDKPSEAEAFCQMACQELTQAEMLLTVGAQA